MSNLYCHAYAICKQFAFAELCENAQSDYKTKVYLDALHIVKGSGNVFVFNYGVVVCWGLSYDEEMHILNDCKQFATDPHEHFIKDEFVFLPASGKSKIAEDEIYLETNEVEEILSLSHGIAQSVKLTEFEDKVYNTIDKTKHIPENIARTGSSQLSGREISKMRGELFSVTSEMNLHYELLDTPEYFWKNPEFETYYNLTARYLDIRTRIEVINHKLTVIKELFDMLADEQKHRHSSMLEWIIIGLIMFEIVYSLAEKIW